MTTSVSILIRELIRANVAPEEDEEEDEEEDKLLLSLWLF